jgi:hypothetical protein
VKRNKTQIKKPIRNKNNEVKSKVKSKVPVTGRAGL